MNGFGSIDLTPHASAQHFFGAELRHCRLRAGLSQRQLAPLVLTAPTMIGKIEMAQRYPTLDFAERCDGALGCDGALVRLHDLVSSERAVAVAESARPSTDPADLLMRLLESMAGIVAIAGSKASSGARTSAVLDNIDAALDSAKATGAIRGLRRSELR